MSEAETLCDRVAIIDYGKLLAVGTVGKLKESLNHDQITHIEGIISDNAVKTLQALPNVLQATAIIQNGETKLTVHVKEGQEALSQIIAILHEHGASLNRINAQEPTLEDVFIAKTGRTLSEDTHGG